MLDLNTQTTILRLRQEGHGTRTIARAVGISRGSVLRVLAAGAAQVPRLERETSLDAHESRVRELFVACKGNLVRVHEELVAEGIAVSYPTVTRTCRVLGLGQKPKVAVGQYHFEPGEEMQHDTSPHRVVIGGREVLVQCASLVLAFSRKRYVQVYPRWDRLLCRHFLSEAVMALGGAAGRCVVDNSSVVIASGTGRNAKAAPALEALGGRFGYTFMAHALGDANRSARVEGPFWHVENNFYAGRTFLSLEDCNAQLRAWCEKVAEKPMGKQKLIPMVLWRLELPHLQPLPLHVPPIYEAHERKVDVEGYVTLHTNRYSVPESWIGRTLEVREEVAQVIMQCGHEAICVHEKAPFGAGARSTKPEHRRRRLRREEAGACEEERALRARAPGLAPLMEKLRERYGGQGRRGMRALLRLWERYPDEAVLPAVEEALRYGLVDLARIERMVVRRLAEHWFRIDALEDDDDGHEPGRDP